MHGQQLELDFEGAIAEALADPVEAEPLELWDSLAPSLAMLDHASQLKAAGQLVSDVAEVIHQRSILLIEDWQDKNNTQGPIPDEDFLSGLIQETMFLDVSSLVRQPKGRKLKPEPKAEEFFAEVADQEALLQELGVSEPLQQPESAEVLEVIEEEDVRAWVDVIAQQLDKAGGKLSLQKLKKVLKLSYGRLWLGLLLGGFALHQSGYFYGANISVSLVQYPSIGE